ncbi:unnamed protein product, partial [Polarella glacialis]
PRQIIPPGRSRSLEEKQLGGAVGQSPRPYPPVDSSGPPAISGPVGPLLRGVSPTNFSVRSSNSPSPPLSARLKEGSGVSGGSCGVPPGVRYSSPPLRPLSPALLRPGVPEATMMHPSAAFSLQVPAAAAAFAQSRSCSCPPQRMLEPITSLSSIPGPTVRYAAVQQQWRLAGQPLAATPALGVSLQQSPRQSISPENRSPAVGFSSMTSHLVPPHSNRGGRMETWTGDRASADAIAVAGQAAASLGWVQQSRRAIVPSSSSSCRGASSSSPETAPLIAVARGRVIPPTASLGRVSTASTVPTASAPTWLATVPNSLGRAAGPPRG